MKKTTVIVPWDQGLHMRPAALLVRVAQSCHSSVHIRFQDRVVDARSIIHVMLLCAAFGAMLEVEVSGEDETGATAAIERVFDSGSDGMERES